MKGNKVTVVLLDAVFLFFLLSALVLPVVVSPVTYQTKVAEFYSGYLQVVSFVSEMGPPNAVVFTPVQTGGEYFSSLRFIIMSDPGFISSFGKFYSARNQSAVSRFYTHEGIDYVIVPAPSNPLYAEYLYYNSSSLLLSAIGTSLCPTSYNFTFYTVYRCVQG